MITKAAAIDLAERAAWTFAWVFLSQFILTDLATAEGAAMAGLGAVLSIVKSFVAAQLGNPESASVVDGAIDNAKHGG